PGPQRPRRAGLTETMKNPAHSVLNHLAQAESETMAPVDVNPRSIALPVIAFAAAMAVLYWAREVFIPIVLSILISYALDPIVVALMRLKVSRGIASALVMITLTGSLSYSAYALSDDAIAVVAELPQAAAK